MRPNSSVEEVLIRTLRRAGELAVPDDVHEPFQIVDQVALRESGHGKSESLTRRSTRPTMRVALTGVAAMILLVVGLVVLLSSSPSITVQRSQLSTVRGEQLLCGTNGCPPLSNGPSVSNASGATSPSFGAVQGAHQPMPQGTWIVADGGHFL